MLLRAAATPLTAINPAPTSNETILLRMLISFALPAASGGGDVSVT
jgi:hypothetical protein